MDYTILMASQNSSSQLRLDLFGRLPAEIRLKIFASTDLVVADRSGRKTGLHIADGEFCDPPAHFMYWHTRPDDCDCPVEFPAELLNRNNPYYSEILEVAFSRNRVVFSGSPVLTMAFLQVHSQGINHIRTLEFQFDIDLIEDWVKSDHTLQLEWEELIAFVRQNLNLSNISLSLNTGNPIPIYQEQQMTEREQGDFRLDAYKMIIKPLRGLGEMGGLRQFYVFWGCYHEYEAEAEREVMGDCYRAVDKVPISRREPSDPWWDSEKEKAQKQEQEKEQEDDSKIRKDG